MIPDKRIGQILKKTSGNMLAVLLIYTTAVLTVTAQMNLTPLGNATQSSLHYSGKPQNAIEPPDSNKWSFDKCTHTSYGRTKAWWMFTFSFGYAYITDIKIYYREHFAYRMDGFKIYVTNTSTIPPDGYLCYEDPDPGLPNITQTIPCFQLGKYVIYYDTKGDGTYGTWGPTVELCYVVIKGCQETFWGSNCTRLCHESCIHQHCYPGNGSCIWGCRDENCLNDVCDKDTLVCKGGCKGRLTGQYCNECPPSYYGNLCQSRCPVNCSGPCDLETGQCTDGCINGRFGETCELDAQCFTDSKMTNCTPEIYQLNPLSGPRGGGTILTISGKYIGSVNDSISIDISGVRCHNVTVGKPHFNLTCVTGKINTNQANGIFVSVNAKTFNDSDNSYFSYKNPTILDFSPTKSFLSGNTTVTIKGPNIGFEGRNRYNISFCDMYNCIACSTFPDTFSSNYIKCKTGNSSKTRNMTRLQVKIDDLTMLQFNGTFRYLPDPKFNIFNRSPKAQLSGGATFTIRGEGFYNVEKITVERVDKHCDVLEDTSVVCKTPQNRRNQPNNQTVHVHFDDLTLPVNVEYVEDPTFEKFPVVYEYDKESFIQIKGRNILSGARLEDYRVHVGLDGSCLLTDIDMQLITCFPPKSVPRTNKTDLNTVHVIVDVGNIKAYIGDLHYKVELNTLSITVGILTAALITAVVISVFAVVIIRKKKKRTIKEFKIELMTREASREEFADAQINIKNIKSDLVTSSVPFRDYQTYILHQLFPNQDIRANHLLQDLEITNDRKNMIKSAMEKMETLLTNKNFLMSLIKILDRPNMLTMQEKAYFSSVLSIALLGNMRLFFELIHCLLIDMIRSSTKKQQKLLFRRFDSIPLRLIVNWLQIGLYRQLTSHSGMQLFMLYKAIQTVIEMGPIDALTGYSKNTIAEEKLLKMKIENRVMTLQIDLNGNSDQHYPVKVLDCDTISQVKQKCCSQIYKNKPASEIPHVNELSLEYHGGRAGKLTLNDIDIISVRNNGFVSLNTLKHYMVTDNRSMSLMYKQHEQDDIYKNSPRFRTERARKENIESLAQEMDEQEEPETQKRHLNDSNLPDDVKSTREVDYGDIFLNRLFHTKLLLVDYIDSAFEGLVDQQSLSISIRYFLCMLDRLGKDYNIESEVLQSWKQECYATRLWSQLIGKPDILFDVNVPGHVDPCLDILRQVVVESFTQTDNKVNKESPTQKLLFHKDIARYRELIGPFFASVMPVTDQEFWSEIDEMSKRQKEDLKFSRQSTLDQL